MVICWPQHTQLPLVPWELENIVQIWIIGLTTIGLNVCLEVNAWITNCVVLHVVWLKFLTWYQLINNAAHLLLKDKLINLCLHEVGSNTEYLKQIQETQLELQGINQHVPKVDIVEQMLNTLPPSYEECTIFLVSRMLFPHSKPLQFILFEKRHVLGCLMRNDQYLV